MLNKWIATSAAIIGLGLSASALATTTNGFYLGAQLGESVSGYDKDSSGINQFFNAPALYGASVSNRAFAARTYLGYQFDKFIAAELGYAYLGNTDFNHIFGISGINTALRQQAGDLSAKVMLPITRQFEVFALGGVAYVYAQPTDISSTAKTLGLDGSSEGEFTPTYGLGVEYDFTPHWGLDLTWRNYVGRDDIEVNNLYTLGMSYHF